MKKDDISPGLAIVIAVLFLAIFFEFGSVRECESLLA